MHMVFFTTPELLEIGGLPLITPYDKPTRLEALRYYRRVVDTYDIQVSYHESVEAIDRGDDGVFAVTTSHRGVTRARHARSVVLAIGFIAILRGARYYGIAWAIEAFGPKIAPLFKRLSGPWMTLITLAIGAATILVLFLR